MSKKFSEQQWQAELAERAANAATAFSELVKTIAALRHPENGCPWDLKQTHKSLRRFMIEEAYEAAELMDSEDFDGLIGELGDVLLQVILNAQLLTDANKGDITNVIDAIKEKMIRRHPHVFSDQSRNLSQDDLHRQWNAIKQAEKVSAIGGAGSNASIFAEAEKMRFPAAMQAVKIGKIAKSIGFDWSDLSQVFNQLQSEIDELEVEISADAFNPEHIELELGDVYFTLAQLCRHLGFDAEVTASKGNKKFLKRFALVELIAESKGIDLRNTSQAVLEGLWAEAKKANELEQKQ